MNYKYVLLAAAFIMGTASASLVCAQEVPQKETEQLGFAQGLLQRDMYDMAVTEYQKFITLYPQSTYAEEAHLGLGESWFLAHDFPKAIDAFNQFRQLYPHSAKLPAAALRLGQIYIEQKMYDQALKELTSVDQQPLKGQQLQSFDYYMGKAYRGKNDTPQALVFFQKAADTPDASTYTADALQELAELYTQNSQYDEAIETYTKAVASTQEQSLKAYYTYKIGETQFLMGKYPEAIKQFHLVLEQYPTLAVNKDALTNLMLSYLNLGQYEILLQEYQGNTKSIKDEAAYLDIHNAAARAYIELNKFDEAQALFNKILSFQGLQDQDKQEIVLEEADILMRQKKYADILSLLERDYPKGAANTDKKVFLEAQAHYVTGNFEQAFQSFKEIQTNYPQSGLNKAAILGMAHARQALGNNKEASDLFYQYYSIEKDDHLKSDALYDATTTAAKSGDKDQAIAKAEEYLKVFPQGSHIEQIVLLLGDLYAKSNQPAKGVPLLQDYLTHADNKQQGAAYFLLGLNEQFSGQDDQALESYGKVPADPGNQKFYLSALKNSASIYLKQKKDAEAAVLFDRMMEQADKDTMDITTYLWVCSAYLKEKKYDDLLRVTGKAEQIFPGQKIQELAYFKAEAYRGKNDCDTALKLYEAASVPEKNMYAAGAQIGKGMCLVAQNHLDEAKTQFQKSLEDNPDDTTISLRARFELANIANTQKDFAEALKLYLLIATIYEDEQYGPESLFKAGLIMENQNRPQEALKLYAEILGKYQQSPLASQAQERIHLLHEPKN